MLSRAAGADDVLVGYDDFPTKVRDLTDGTGVDAVYDGVGKATFDGSLDARCGSAGPWCCSAAPAARCRPSTSNGSTSGGSLKLTRPNVDHFVLERAELLAAAPDVFGWVADGSLTVRIGGTYPLAEAPARRTIWARRPPESCC